MRNLDNLLTICRLYKQGNYGIKEFQSRLITASIPDNLSKEFINKLVHFDNQIEEIIFCQSEAEYKKYADKVADELIQATISEQERLKGHRSYKAE